MKVFEYEKLEKATENFSKSRLIGKGSHGYVYKGILEDGKIIAIKKQSLGLQKIQDYSKLENEVSILSSLFENSLIVNFLGTSNNNSAKNETFLIMEYLPNGTLHEMIHAKNVPPPWPKRAQVAIQVAKAIQFLHQTKPSIVHRDIKSTNVLFDSNWNAKLADLGLALRLKTDCEDDDPYSPSHRSNSVTRPAGTIGYLDPSYTKPSKLSTKNDIFSFGVLLLEIMSSRKVIDVSKSPVSIVDWAIILIKEGRDLEICDKRMHVPWYMEATIKNMLRIATRCVSPKKITRPSIQEIVKEMENVIIEPTKYPLWNILRSLTLLKRKRKRCRKDCNIIITTTVAKTCAQHEGKVEMDMSRGKLLIREILADKAIQ
ncbi:serine/threonine-protein kinase-like protein At5g23170 [Nicotiana tabacum]|uniref:Serine/threonine-protein kinase-like protein At5g23170 n=1 Tax=Nicotiana tabacum TaxID=4097 RepID=A0A1S4B0M3_TOBAC|nr:serine/threonine-protein kinase-like protein At5g23170 [Nicotiana tomentosiformis]XP_016482482.1 PREDICTED: serine/threonine-protein kinase-like protein At5g23170 [Nicotiana tabacum]